MSPSTHNQNHKLAPKLALKLAKKQTTEDPELLDRFDRVLSQTAQAMDGSGLRYVFIGGIASSGLGRPRSTHDIDIFVRPEDAELTLRSLAKHGFRTEKTDPTWLYKAFKEDVLVDVIFKSKGEIYLDAEMYQRSSTSQFHGQNLRLVAPEDLLIIKAAAYSEITPGHWHDAIGLLSHARLDWTYLLSRARRAPRRILSLLLYAQSNDVWVPNEVVRELYEDLFGDSSRKRAAELSPRPSQLTQPAGAASATHSLAAPPAYVAAHIRQILAEDPRTHELDIDVEFSGDRLILSGEVPLQDRREAVERTVKEFLPRCQVENRIRVPVYDEPAGTEDLK